MRTLILICSIGLLCGMAAAQATVIGGNASTWAPAYGVYAAPFVPLVVTPSAALATIAPQTGPSSSAFGLTAGASNSTLEMGTAIPNAVYSQPEWYGPAPSAYALMEVRGESGVHQMMHRRGEAAFDFIAANWESSQGIAGRVPSAGSMKKASHTYTNQDIDAVNQKTGNVKYDGKTEQIH